MPNSLRSLVSTLRSTVMSRLTRWTSSSRAPTGTGSLADRNGPSPTQVARLGWVGTRTRHADELAKFYEQVLHLRLTHREPGFWVFELPDGSHVEVFGTDYPGKDHFDSGPVTGFAVNNLSAAVRELRDAGVALVGEPGPTWQHFRGPDGNVYELVSDEQHSPSPGR